MHFIVKSVRNIALSAFLPKQANGDQLRRITLKNAIQFPLSDNLTRNDAKVENVEEKWKF